MGKCFISRFNSPPRYPPAAFPLFSVHLFFFSFFLGGGRRVSQGVGGVTPREEDDANLMAYGPLIPLSTYIALLGFSELFRHRPACCNAQLPAHGAGRQMDRHRQSISDRNLENKEPIFRQPQSQGKCGLVISSMSFRAPIANV